MDLEAMRQIFKNQMETENIIYVGNTGFEASDDHLIVLQDEFRSGYECARCGDKDHRIKRGGLDGQTESVVDCDNCDGMGKYPKNGLEIRCSHCEGTGKIACPDCNGRGSKTIVQPQSTKGRPTTGIVVSVGKNAPTYQRGEKLCYPSFAGHAFDLAGVDDEGKAREATLVILTERDILAKVHGTLEKRNVKRSMALSTGA